jgi:hypothetical protein
MNDQHALSTARTLVRRGDFIGARTDSKLIADLIQIRSGNEPESNYAWLTSRALLCEIYDQTGAYEECADILANSPVRRIKESLRRDASRFSTDAMPPILSDDERRLVRSRILFVLQDGIHNLRKRELDSAGRAMRECLATIDSINSKYNRFYGVSSLVQYWLGRLEIARNRHRDALDHFNASMLAMKDNLIFHYSVIPANLQPGDERIAYAVYSIASSMAFGVAQIHQIGGHLIQSLDLLRWSGPRN